MSQQREGLMNLKCFSLKEQQLLKSDSHVEGWEFTPQLRSVSVIVRSEKIFAYHRIPHT